MAQAPITLHVDALDDGGYLATSPDVPGLIAHGRTIAEATAMACDVTRKIIESCRQNGDPLPPALQDADPRFARLPGSDDGEPVGRLAGFTRRDITRKLRQFGYVVDRQTHGGDEIWRHVQSGRKVTIPHHDGDLPKEALRAILRAAARDVEDFLRD